MFGSACGRKALPRPPENVVPRQITDLSGTDTTQGIQLSWSRPVTYADGSHMPDLGGFIVERAVGDDVRAAFQRISSLDVSDRDRLRQIKRFRYVDQNTEVGTAYRYRVVSFTIDRYFSAPSNTVPVTRAAAGENTHASFPTTER